MSEFINQYTDEDVENVFGAHSEYDYVRKVMICPLVFLAINNMSHLMRL